MIIAMDAPLPAIVTEAHARAEAAGFELSCEPAVGRLLAALAAALPQGGRILELGTGAGVGLAWLVYGLGERDDAELVSVELDPATRDLAAEAGWPDWVRFELGDGAERAASLGRFDLVFADAPGGKLTGLDHSIEALRPGGVLVVDDMDLSLHDDAELRSALAGVRDALHADSRLAVAELEASSGIILATRRRTR
jgi:demethylmenaquinone methyltransferase/2-methoxy-6-polyprenyl-1,4-benzoquinol methylase